MTGAEAGGPVEGAPGPTGSHIFGRLEEVFYGTDDGHPEPDEDGRFDERGTENELEPFRDLYRRVGAARRRDIHLITVVGGFYALNLIPLFRPRRITLVDVNPYQIAFGRLILRLFSSSASAAELLDRLADGGYPAHGEVERALRRNLALKQRGELTPDHGRSKRTLARSWRFALDEFDLTRRVLARARFATRVEALESPSFAALVRDRPDLWLFCSNVFLFSRPRLVIRRPANAAIFATYFAATEIVDLASFGGGPVAVECGIPMRVLPAGGDPPPTR